MNELVLQESQGLVISERQVKLIRAGVSANTLKAYRHALKKLESLAGRSRS